MGTVVLVVMWSGVWFSLAIQLVAAADKCPLEFQELITNTTLFLDAKEELVKSIAGFAVQNYLNSSAVAACNNDTVCSRGVCMPLRRDLAESALVCEAIPLNVDCVGRHNITCTTALLSRDMAYIRLSPLQARMANYDCNISATICAQQALDDQIFKSNKFSTYENQGQNSLTLQSYIYFGSNNGVWRIYPGKELNQTACNNQDVRKRPWYVGATSVQKELVVLMDSRLGSLTLSASTGTETFFDAAQNVTLELLETLTKGDNVSVLTFGSHSSSLVGKGTVGNASSLNDPALAPLMINVTDQDPGTDGSKSNLTLGLLAALGRFDESLTQLKVVIIFTAGDITGEDLPESLIEDLTSRNVTVFIYRFLVSMDGNDDVTTMLKKVSCTLRGWYEEAFYSVPNPLGTLQSYYSYVARLRFNQSSQGKPYWVPQFASTSGLGTVIAVAYPAFDGETLVGVAGADLLVDNLKLTASDLDSLLTGRNTLDPLPISDPLQPIACNQTLGVQDDSFCQSVLPDRVTGFCTNDTDTNPDKREALLERVCCKDCCPWKSADGLSTGELAGIIAGSSVLGIVLGALCCCVIWKFCTQRNRPAQPVYPGGGQMRSPASESGISDPRHSNNNSPLYKYDDKM